MRGGSDKLCGWSRPAISFHWRWLHARNWYNVLWMLYYLIPTWTAARTYPRHTQVIIGAMYAIRKWSFRNGETFGDIATGYRKTSLLNPIDVSTSAVTAMIIKAWEQQNISIDIPLYANQRYTRSAVRLRHRVQMPSLQLPPTSLDFWTFYVSHGEQWRISRNPCVFILEADSMKIQRLYIVIENECAVPVTDLGSTQKEADTRVLLHAVPASWLRTMIQTLLPWPFTTQ